ncbi:MAG: ATP-dependent DNA helicase [Thermoplasmatota archaeon]
MELFPYHERKNQTAIMQTIQRVLNDRNHLILESGTGSGKTICAITATLSYALEHDKKIVYITRTNAQQRQVIVELRAIRAKINNKTKREQIFGVGIQGRSHMCLHAKNDEDFQKGTSEELSKFCANEKKKARTSKKGCIYYRHFVEDKDKVKQTKEWVTTDLPTAEEFINRCEQQVICPYELNKTLVREARLVVVPYIYVFNDTIRNMLWDWLGRSEEEMILIVDEAHNLPDYIRDLYSLQLSYWMVKNCSIEAKKYGNPSMADGRFTVSSFSKTLGDILMELRDTYVYNIMETGIQKTGKKNQDAFLPSQEFETEVLSRLKLSQKKIHDIIEDLIAYGEKIQEYKQKQNQLPRSYLHKLGIFLDFWLNLHQDQYAKLVVDAAEGRNPRIEAYCLDPSVGSNIVKKFHATVHMSGTLEPLEEYRDSMGLPADTTLVSFPSPFPKTNRKLFYVNDVTTKYSEMVRKPEMTDTMWQYITDICNSFPHNTMVFFPSFNIMSMFKRKNDFDVINRSVFLEEQKMSQAALMDLVSDFKSYGESQGEGATMFSVMGGRISEGMDFPAEQLEIVVIVGIPYPKPTARQRGLQRYYELKFRKGWEYTVEAPTARKLLQSIGRLIRDQNDRGVVVILDRRARRFKKYLKELRPAKNLNKEIQHFFHK